VGGVARGNALVVFTWIVTRTAGALVGPAATVPERAGFGDLVATVMQVPHRGRLPGPAVAAAAAGRRVVG
jgi:hypothetical protein